MAFIPLVPAGVGADRNLNIGPRGGLWLLTGHFQDLRGGLWGTFVDGRTFVGPRGGLWTRIGWWTDVVQVQMFVCLFVVF